VTALPHSNSHRLGEWLLLAVLALAAGCGDAGTAGQAPATPTSLPAPTTTVAAVSKPCLRAAERDKLFRFRTGAGATLVGVILGTGRTGLVVGHQLGSDLCEWLPQARAFAKRGYRVLAFDFAGFGDSAHGSGPDARVDADVVAATGQLRRRGADEVVLVVPGRGHGTGMLEFGEDAAKVLATVREFIAEHTRR
jgi:pimeloyl-ACP methyl ester carboxylesterase